MKIEIEAPFHGPPDSANGGYTCGLIAKHLAPTSAAPVAVEVTLRKPPPLDTPMDLEVSGDGAKLRHGDALIAEAKLASLALDLPEPVTIEQAREASTRYPGLEQHSFPTCFVCGPRRHEAGIAVPGLSIFAGPVQDRSVAASPWTIGEALGDEAGLVRPEFIWAALDCPSFFGVHAFTPFSVPAVLGRLTGRIESRPRAGSTCVVMGWAIETEGRKIHAASALFGAKGELYASARATWILLRG